MTTGSKIQNLRKKQNITQEQLADYLGVSRQSVSKWESDGAYPETDKLIRMGSLFHVSLDYLLQDDYEEEDRQSRKNESMKFNTDTFVLILLSVFGYVLGVTLVYITEDTLVGFLVIFGILFIAAILYIFRRSRYLLKSEYSDSDRKLLMQNTKAVYSVDLLLAFLFLPLMVFSRIPIEFDLGGIAVTVHGILTFPSYFLTAIPFGLFGGFLLLGITYLHKKIVINRPTGKMPSAMLVSDMVASSIGFLLLLVLFFTFQGIEDYFMLLVFGLIITDMIVLPLVSWKRKRMKTGLFVSFMVASAFALASLLLITDWRSEFYLLSLIMSVGNIGFWGIRTGKDFRASFRNRDAFGFVAVKAAGMILILTLWITAYRWMDALSDTEATVWPRLSLVVLSLFIMAGFFGADRLFLKKSLPPTRMIGNEAV